MATNEHGTVNAVRTHLARVRESHTKRQQGLSAFVQAVQQAADAEQAKRAQGEAQQ